jgi:hypothetical protein
MLLPARLNSAPNDQKHPVDFPKLTSLFSLVKAHPQQVLRYAARPTGQAA